MDSGLNYEITFIIQKKNKLCELNYPRKVNIVISICVACEEKKHG